MKVYKEEEYLMLSGIQHFCFCRRQWALIHIENQWQENVYTVEGQQIHKNAHNSKYVEKRDNIIITRGMPVYSAYLGISGICDIVEFLADSNGIEIQGRKGKYNVYPVEYKRGHQKESDADILQLVAQAMCLEEMLCCEIEKGYLFYHETHRRQEIYFSEKYRSQVKEMVSEMHDYYARGYTPKVKMRKSCNACSLKDICIPKLNKKLSVKTYIEKSIKANIDEEIT